MADPVCCKKCGKRGMCAPGHACCLECHFAYEEKHALPHLPPLLQDQLRKEHAYLRQRGFPPLGVHLHAIWEDVVFRAYCPPDVCAMIQADHKAHGRGELDSRDQAVARSASRLSA